MSRWVQEREYRTLDCDAWQAAVYFDQREQQWVERRLVQRLERLGYKVSLQPRALAS